MAAARPELAIHRTCAQNPAARDAVSRRTTLPSKTGYAISPPTGPPFAPSTRCAAVVLSKWLAGCLLYFPPLGFLVREPFPLDLSPFALRRQSGPLVLLPLLALSVGALRSGLGCLDPFPFLPLALRHLRGPCGSFRVLPTPLLRRQPRCLAILALSPPRIQHRRNCPLHLPCRPPAILPLSLQRFHH